MFALKAKTGEYQRIGSLGIFRENTRVLPRLLRRPVRFFSRLLAGDIAIPKYAEGFGIAAVLGGAIFYGAVVGGQLGQAVETVTSKMGFAVAEIEIAGNTHTTANDVFAALGLADRRSLLSMSAIDARQSLTQLPWVGSARIAKVYPDKLKIEITERDAFAVWQQGEALTVIEQDGSVIGGYAADVRLAALPLLVGKGAADIGSDFIDLVAGFNQIAPRVRAYIRVGTRRWNLRLDNGITVQLPEHNVDVALARLTDMQTQLNVMDRDLAGIDLRFGDRTVFALTENARNSRDAFVKARTEAARKARKARGSRI